MPNDIPVVLLINPNRIKPAVAPLGLDYLASALKRSGFEPHLFDMNFISTYQKPLAAQIQKLQPIAIGISVRNFDDCYFASQAFLLPPIKSLVGYLKRMTEVPIILGGVGFSIAPNLILNYTGADLGIRGDGEEAFPQLLKALINNDEPQYLKGLVRPGDQPVSTTTIDLEYFPAPQRKLVDCERYFKDGGQGNIETKRGCNQKCIYCADPLAKGRVLRMRPADSVVDELQALIERGVHTFHFCDSEFNIPPRHAVEVCQRIIRRGLDKKMRWYTYMSPHPFSREMARLMARAGCAGINFGADSGSDKMLHNLGRSYGADQLVRNAGFLRDYKLTFMYDLLLGGPGETRETLKQTIELIKHVRPDRVGVSMGVRVVPGTALADMVEQAGPLGDNPNLQGALKGNQSMLEPIFYLDEGMGPNPGTYIQKLIDDDPMFLFANPEDMSKNYNYNNNRVLVQAIKKGARGAYWDILRKMG